MYSLFSSLFLSAAQAGGDLPPGRVFGLDVQTFISVLAHLINISLLAFVLTKVLYKPVRDYMAKRAERIRGQLERARAENEKADEYKAQYEALLKQLEGEREAILEAARKKASETGRAIIAEARAEADALREKAAASIAAERERAREGMRLAIVDVSAVMAERLLARSVSEDDRERMLGEAMAELEAMEWRS